MLFPLEFPTCTCTYAGDKFEVLCNVNMCSVVVIGNVLVHINVPYSGKFSNGAKFRKSKKFSKVIIF